MVLGRKTFCRNCQHGFCLMCGGFVDPKTDCGVTSGFCEMYYDCRFDSVKQGKRVRRHACEYWIWALLAVVTYPVWGFVYWISKVCTDFSARFWKCCDCRGGGGGCPCEQCAGYIMLFGLFLGLFGLLFALGFVFGFFYVLICPCKFSSRK